MRFVWHELVRECAVRYLDHSVLERQVGARIAAFAGELERGRNWGAGGVTGYQNVGIACESGYPDLYRVQNDDSILPGVRGTTGTVALRD